MTDLFYGLVVLKDYIMRGYTFTVGMYMGSY